MPAIATSAVIDANDPLSLLLHAQNPEPHSFLGMHPHTMGGVPGLMVRAFLPQASGCEVVDLTRKPERRYPMLPLSPEGFFEMFIAKRKCPDNPWGVGATTLEWTLSSPPPFHTFNELPKIT